MDGRFLQGTFNGKLKLNDERPDVSCGGEGGVSTLRSLDDQIAVGMADGSARFLDAKKLSFTTWAAALTPAGGEVLARLVSADGAKPRDSPAHWVFPPALGRGGWDLFAVFRYCNRARVIRSRIPPSLIKSCSLWVL